MQIRKLQVNNFRGIAKLDWKPGAAFCCLIGAGDSGKSTILDAIEAVLSSRWFAFTESDFLGCNTSRPVIIEATVGELSKALKSDERFGLYIRGWTKLGDLRDEPEDDDEPVLTVRLTVDATMEPVWELVCERVDDSRTLSNRDRALFGLVRLAGEDSRHLAWGQGSVLSRLTGDTTEAGARLAEAYRAAKASANLGSIKSLADAADRAEELAKGLGTYVEGSYEPGLELGRSGLSSGSIALHDNGVPLRLAGLGSRRLATLAIQKSAISEGAIVLVDEIEHGLEPHRIIGAIAQLKADQRMAQAALRPIGQILMTTHSEVALGEAKAESLRVVQIARPNRVVNVLAPITPATIQALMRFTPRALFSHKVLITEGNTEVGMLLGIREQWPPRHGGKPIEQLAASIADGNGEQASQIAQSLAELGYCCAIYRDSDTAISSDNLAALAEKNIPIFEYGGGLNTEQAIFSAATDEQVQELLDYAREERGIDAIDNNLDIKFPEISLEEIRGTFKAWALLGNLDAEQLREAIAEVAARKKWFKDQRIGRGLAPIVWRVMEAAPRSPLATTMNQVEAWLYA
ncbi:hypothetical protein THUN1379_21080 [Paludibacterium sp. THUN1379]|uniref:ATP-dependent nuclease n=1 Tax=Paludibacterium sp. THUN1379 TaxID=3112107 RepID=UPI003092E9C9|nr:hypothetical protein THUN1379_21080 [Paludibacterium sp. THUN1379]